MAKQDARLPAVVAVLGTNASGKSDLAVRIAEAFDAEVVSADSRQVYEGIPLATGKISMSERRGVEHHLLDVAPIGKRYSLADYQEAAFTAICGILDRNRLPLLVGGTGLYRRVAALAFTLPATEKQAGEQNGRYQNYPAPHRASRWVGDRRSS